jgi:hypothetical protein
MDKKGLRDITAEFLLLFEGLKPLAEELRHVFFPVQDESLFAGTYGGKEDVDSIYGSMIKGFENAII